MNTFSYSPTGVGNTSNVCPNCGYSRMHDICESNTTGHISYAQAKEAARLNEEQRLWLEHHGIPEGQPRNRHERRKARKLLRQL